MDSASRKEAAPINSPSWKEAAPTGDVIGERGSLAGGEVVDEVLPFAGDDGGGVFAAQFGVGGRAEFCRKVR